MTNYPILTPEEAVEVIRHNLLHCFELHRNLIETGAMLPGTAAEK